MANNNCTNKVPSLPLSVPNGGTGSTTVAAHATLIGNGTGVATQLSGGATKSVLTGNTGANPSFIDTAIPITSITFGAGTTLSNYVEGSFTATLTGATTAGTSTYTKQNGYYRRIGNLAFIQLNVAVSAATGTGDATIGGLPFTIKNQTGGNPVGPALFNGSTWAYPSGCTFICAQGIINTTTAVLVGSGSSTAASNLQMHNGVGNITLVLIHQI